MSSGAMPIPGTPYHRLAPEDMVLHAAAHLFQDGDIRQGLRELIDLDGLLRSFGAQADFWTLLTSRAPELDLHRPMFYAARYCCQYLGTPIPDAALAEIRAWRPPAAILAVMDVLVARTLIPALDPGASAWLARWLLYVRSHWLRMPPAMLAGHLARQAWRRWFPKAA